MSTCSVGLHRDVRCGNFYPNIPIRPDGLLKSTCVFKIFSTDGQKKYGKSRSNPSFLRSPLKLAWIIAHASLTAVAVGEPTRLD